MNNAEIRHPDGSIEHPAVKYEPKDIRFGCILALLLVGCVVAAIHLTLIWKFFGWQRSEQNEVKKTPYRLSQANSLLPPEPRLEQLDRLAKEEGVSGPLGRQVAKEKTLNEFGPTPEEGYVHIPIRQAMKAIAGKLPVENRPEPSKDNAGLLDAGESNSGRILRGEE